VSPGCPRRGSRRQGGGLIFVGIRDDLGTTFSPPSSLPDDLELEGGNPVVRDAIRDLPWIPAGTRKESIAYRPRCPVSDYEWLLRPSWMNDVIDAHVTRWHRPQDLRALRLLSQGGIYADLPRHLRRYRTDIFRDKYRRLSWDASSPCLTAQLSKDCYSHIHPSQARTISIREAARLQGFPDWYKLEGNLGDRYRLLGNAVPPIVAYAIAVSVREALGQRATMGWHTLARHNGREFAGGGHG